MKLKKEIDKKTAVKVVAGFMALGIGLIGVKAYMDMGETEGGYEQDYAQDDAATMRDVTPHAPREVQPAPAQLQPSLHPTTEQAVQTGAAQPASAPLGAAPAAQQAVSMVDEQMMVAQTGSIEEMLNNEAALAREIRVLKMQAEKKKLMDEINGVPVGQSSVQFGAPLPPPGMQPPQVEDASNMADFEMSQMRVLSIFGEPGRLMAEIQDNSMKVNARVGQALGDGWKVSKIEATRVVLVKGKKTRTLILG